jgi:hypothetical protein
MVKQGWRAVYVPTARAVEKMVPTVEGEFARKRRMMSHAWPIVLRGGLLSPRGYPPLYALMVASHRLLRYATPFLHLVALIANAALLGQGRRARKGRRPLAPQLSGLYCGLLRDVAPRGNRGAGVVRTHRARSVPGHERDSADAAGFWRSTGKSKALTTGDTGFHGVRQISCVSVGFGESLICPSLCRLPFA